MAVTQVPFLAAMLLLVSSGFNCSSTLPACPEFCTCQRAPLLNCSSSGLSLVPQHIQDSVTELDLSHNLLDYVTLHRPHHNLRNVWLGNNSITHLSLCIERAPGSQYVRGRYLHRLRPWKRRCISWAPTLQLLSVESNQLVQLPEGLDGSESLQVLQLSFNRISALQPGVLSNLQQLKELHLQHNLITSLHPQLFQDLAQLRVLDLSFNMLTSLHPLMYLSLRNIGADLDLGGNRWQCDCSMRSLRRLMAYDSSRSMQSWSIVCASPSILSGRDLLQLEENDLNCFSSENRPELHQDVTVYSGSEIQLSCSVQDSLWWTPNGQASVSQPQTGLLIKDITERDTGLYVCVSEEHEVVSVFNLHISRIGGTRRKTRSLSRTSQQIIAQGTSNGMGQERNQRATQPDLALAVCLSVFFTFLIAFILGVLARPLIDVLWRRVTNKKSSSETNSVSSVEQRQYDNEAYSNGEEPEEVQIHRERRVTFNTVDFREDSNVQYYDTVASGEQESINNDPVIECEAAEAEKDKHTSKDSGSENSLRQNSPEDNQRDGDRTHNMEFENIPDVVEMEERIRLSSHSSSLSDKELKQDQMIQGHHTAEDSVQFCSTDFSTARKEVPQFSIEGTSEIPGFSSEPFVDWLPHTNTTNLTDPELWQDDEEQFEFSDSVRSTSARSSCLFGSFNDSKLIVAPTSDKQKGDMSSSSSYVSGDEPSHYTVNSDKEEEEDIRRISSSSSSESEAEITDLKVEHNKGRVNEGIESNERETPSTHLDGQYIPQIKRHLDIQAPLPASDSSSSDDSVDETTKHSEKQKQEEFDMTWLPIENHQSVSHDSMKLQQPTLHLGYITPIKRRLDIKAPSPPADSSSSNDSEDETINYKEKQEQEMHMERFPIKISQTVSHEPETQWPTLDLEHIPHIARRLDIKAPSTPPESSSSSDSEDETIDYIKKQRPGKVDIAGLPFQESQTLSHDPETHWPTLDLEHTTCIKRRLDIKAPSPATDSSSSDSEDEATGHTEKQRPGKVNIAEHPFQESQAESHDPETWWPTLDLEHSTCIKRRLDIKAPLPTSDSSSSSDSEDETTNHIKKHEQEETYMARPPVKVSQTVSHEPETQWPTLDLEHIPHVTRRLDIKAPSPPPDSSSSSDSEDETIGYIKKQRPGKLDIAGLPFQETQTLSHDPKTRWPALDLKHTTHIKRRLDIKAPSPPPDSSSSSDGEDETTGHTEKQRPGKVDIGGLPFQEIQAESHDPETQWPTLDLEHIPRITRRLDIKAPSPPPDSSSSSDGEDETTGYIKKQKPGKLDIAGLPFQESQTSSLDPETQWPALDLKHITRIKRHLNIKGPSLASDSSSSSDSGDETIGHTEKQRAGKVDFAGLPFQETQTLSHDPKTRWPALDLKHTTHIKRRLDIKAPSPPPDSSSSSDGEDETTGHTEKQRPGKVDIGGLPFQETQAESHDPETQWPTLDLEHIPRITRRLDIKTPSPPPDSSSSNDSEDETTDHTEKQRPGVGEFAGLPFQKSPTVSHDPGTQWLAVDLGRIMHIKRCLDIKAPLPPSNSFSNGVSQGSRESESNSSTSDSEDENKDHKAKVSMGASTESKATEKEFIRSPKTPVNISHSPKTEHNIKLEKYTVITDDVGDKTTSETISTTPEINPELQSQWATMNLGFSRFRKRLEITPHTHDPPNLPLSPPPDSPSSSSSESGIGSKSRRTKRIDRLRKDFRLPTTEEQSKSDTMLTDVGTPHVRRYLGPINIGDKCPATPPLQQLPDCFSSSENKDDSTEHVGKGWRESQNLTSLLVAQAVNIKLDQTQSQTEDLERKARTELKSQTSKVGNELDLWHHLSITNVPHIQRALNIRAPLQRESSSSSSEEEKMDHRVPNLSLGVPRVKQRLNIKAPSPQPSNSPSSCSNSESEVIGYTAKQTYSRHTSNLSGMTDDDLLINYKRLIIKSSPVPSDSFPSSGTAQTTDHTRQRHTQAEMVTAEGSSHSLGDRNAPLAPCRAPKMSFDAVVKKRIKQFRHTTDVDLPPEIRWTGVGRHLSDPSISSPRRHLDVSLLSPQQAPPAKPEHPPPDSSNSSSSESDDQIKQERGKTDATPMQKYSSLKIWRVVSEDKGERKGLSALKAMSSERRKWDTEYKELDMGTPPLCDDQGPQGDISSNHHRSEEYIKPLAKQSKPELLLSVNDRRAADLLYGIPQYRRHVIEASDPPQELPPPIPATPPPDEATDFTWRSPQNSKKLGCEITRSSLQQNRNMEEPDPS